MRLKKSVGVALGIEHADLVIPGTQVAFRAGGEIALDWGAAAEQDRYALLWHGHGLVAHDPVDHLLDQAIGPEEDFFGAAMEAKGFLEIDLTGIQASTTAQGCEHGAVVAPLDQVLQGAAAPAVGQVGHVEDHNALLAPNRFWDQMAPVGHEVPLGIEGRHNGRRELGWSGDAHYGLCQTPAEAIG